jgi:hypothetical protein
VADTKTEVRIPCGNEDHDDPAPASARLSWPDGRFRPALACQEDLEEILAQRAEERLTLLIEPIRPEGKRRGPKDYTGAIREVERAYRYAHAEPVKAILLEAPDAPSYEELPETLEEREKLPARFHTPHWMGDCTPKSWVCNVCWDEGTTTRWPCKTAAEHGGEVFAR